MRSLWPAERLVDGVVDDLVDQVVEAARAGRADVHARPQPDRLEPFEDRDVLCGVSSLSHQVGFEKYLFRIRTNTEIRVASARNPDSTSA